MKKTLLTALIAGIIAFAYAQVPSTLSYQGILVKTSPPADAGKPVDDGTHFVRFRFYTTPSGGTPVYSSIGTGSGNQVTTFKGMFSFIIGSGTPGNDPIPANIFSSQLFVEIEADGVTFPTRIPLTTTPYAFVAQSANTMNAANLTGTLDPARIAAGAIDNSKLASGIDASKLTTGTLPAARIGNDAIDNAKMADNAINTAELVNNAVTSAKIADGTIVTVDLADAAVTSAKIADGTVAAVDLADAAVTSVKIADGTIAAVDIADGAVTLAKHADNSVNSAKIVDGSIATVDIADGAITAAKLASGATLTGVGANNRLAFWTGTNSLSANDKLSTDGSNLGIGVATPGNFLHVAADVTGNTNTTLEGHSTTASRGPGISFLRSKGSIITPAAVANGDYLGGFTALGRTTSAYNISSGINFEVDGTPSGTSVPGRIVFSTTLTGSSTATEKMRLTNNGRLGIGTNAPASFLDVATDGNQWNLSSTEGDFRIGTSTHRIKMGIATAGGGAGDAYIGSQGGTNRLFLGAGTTIAQFQTIALTGGNVGIGTSSPSSTLSVGANKFNVAGADGDLTFSDPEGSVFFPTLTAAAPPMIHMFTSGTTNTDRYVIAHSPSFSNWGLMYSDVADRFDFTGNGIPRLSINLGSSASVGINTGVPDQALSVNGNASKIGGGSWATFSDIRMKKDIHPFKDGLDVLLKINPVRFKYNGLGGYENDNKDYVGVIAQEMSKIAPYMISTIRKKLSDQDTEASELLMYDGSALTYILVNSIKEQQAQIDELKKEIVELKKMVRASQSTTTSASAGNE